MSRSTNEHYYFKVDAIVMLKVEQPDRPGGNTILHLDGGHTVTIPKRIISLETVVEAIRN